MSNCWFELTLKADYEHGLKFLFFAMHIAHPSTTAERNVQAEPHLCDDCEAVATKKHKF